MTNEDNAASKRADFKAISKKWMQEWSEKKAFHAKEDPVREKAYILEMFPYPSSAGLHMGHALNYTIGDIQARYKRMKGYNVMYPMGYDAFGLPAENAAIKAGEHPASYTENSMRNFIEQQKELGLSYDWDRMVVTCRPDYYKWNQYFFIRFFKEGLVHRKKSAVNWCPKCNTVLANEQVHSGKCWRHSDTDVEVKQLEQWFIKTTKYSDELLEDVKKLDWPNRIKIMQENWIGKSEGTEVNFSINGHNWPVFTTRIDTVFGVTFLVVAAQHPRLHELVTPDQKHAVDEFVKKIKSVSEKEMEELSKEGVFTGSYAVNPFTQEKVPVYAGNFVIAEYGSGMVMAVPAHDTRDFEFAKKYHIPIKKVIEHPDDAKFEGKPTTEYGTLVNSGEFSGLTSEDAIKRMQNWLVARKIGKKTFNYKFRDWLVSRQRYWGTPIPFIYCDKCGVVPEKIENLPVLLPKDVKFGEGNPLATNHEFVNAKCPVCGHNARRETDTMDTFFDSSWYFLRYCDSKNENEPFSKAKVKHWMPTEMYIGGAEHACMHLIYARFFTKALRDMHMLEIDEPFPKLFNQGMLHGSDGNKMSKSLGNVINPIEMIDKYSADSLRFNLMSLAAPDSDSVWNDNGMESSHKFISRAYHWLMHAHHYKESSRRALNKLHKTIRDVEADINAMKYNIALIKIRDCLDTLEKEEMKLQDILAFAKVLHPFCPFITEEAWHHHKQHGFISHATWPAYDESLIDEKIDAADELVSNTLADIHAVKKLTSLTTINRITIAVSPQWKYELYSKIKETLEKTRNPGEILKEIMSTPLKQYGQDVTKIIPAILKDPSKMPNVIIGQKLEEEALLEAQEKIEETFDADVVILTAEHSTEAKAKNASPGKPAIMLS
jgi:leucyl-tRNA synthetase